VARTYSPSRRANYSWISLNKICANLSARVWDIEDLGHIFGLTFWSFAKLVIPYDRTENAFLEIHPLAYVSWTKRRTLETNETGGTIQAFHKIITGVCGTISVTGCC